MAVLWSNVIQEKKIVPDQTHPQEDAGVLEQYIKKAESVGGIGDL